MLELIKHLLRKVGLLPRKKRTKNCDTQTEHALNELRRRLSRDELVIYLENERIKKDEARIKALEAQACERHEVESFRIVTKKGANLPNAINGILAGQTGTFQAVLVPADSVMPPGQVPVWQSDNAAAAVSIDQNDASGLTASVAVDAAASGSFNLTVSVTKSDGTQASGTAEVPILQAPPVELSSFDLVQTS